MLKTLIKKQLLEVNAWLFQDRKTGKLRSRKGMIGQLALYIFLFCYLMVMFGLLGSGIIVPMQEVGLGWMYWVIMLGVALMLGVFGSVFNTFATLYQAKDNALLLTMPIPPRMILIARFSGVWLWSLIYESLVFLPALVIWYLHVPVTLTGVLCSLCMWQLVGILVLTLSAILGWVVAKINSKLKHKSFLTVIISLAFLGVYFFFCARWYDVMQLLLVHMDKVSEAVRSKVYPVYAMGRACEGSLPHMLQSAAVILAMFALVCLVMSRTFLRMVTATAKTTHRTYRKVKSARQSVFAALLRKEFSRLTSSSTYMLNAGMSTLMMLVAAVALLWKKDVVYGITFFLPDRWLICMIAAAVVCFVSSMNTFAAPSVSLEGKTLWLLQTMPVSPVKVLLAKAGMHFILTELPMLILSAAIIDVLRFKVPHAALLLLCGTLFVVLTDVLQLAVGVKYANLKWTNETIPVKQSLPVFVGVFGGSVILVALGAGYWFLRNVFAPAAWMGLSAGVMAIGIAVLVWYLTHGGAEKLATMK